jgi:hypothetical protein
MEEHQGEKSDGCHGWGVIGADVFATSNVFI